MSSNELPALRLANEIGDKLVNQLNRASIPIVGYCANAIDDHGPVTIVSGQPILPMGTGTLFRIGGSVFLVTAAHVFRKCDKESLIPCIGTGDPPRPTQLTGELRATDEVTDVAVLKLDGAIARAISPETPFSAADVDLRGDLGDGWYFVAGYPIATPHAFFSFSTLNTLQVSWRFRTSLYQGPTRQFENYHDSAHILLDYSGEFRHADDLSRAEPLSTLRGISGSSVWLGFSEHHIADDWNPDLSKIVAVETAVYESAIRATRWIVVAKVLWDNFVETREELARVIPDEHSAHFLATPSLK